MVQGFIYQAIKRDYYSGGEVHWDRQLYTVLTACYAPMRRLRCSQSFKHPYHAGVMPLQLVVHMGCQYCNECFPYALLFQSAVDWANEWEKEEVGSYIRIKALLESNFSQI